MPALCLHACSVGPYAVDTTPALNLSQPAANFGAAGARCCLIVASSLPLLHIRQVGSGCLRLVLTVDVYNIYN